MKNQLKNMNLTAHAGGHAVTNFDMREKTDVVHFFRIERKRCD